MKLTFVGSAADSISLSRGRSSGGWILEADDTHIHVDPGPGAVHQSRVCGINIRQTTAIIVTSQQLYTSHDLHPFIDAMTYSGLDRLGVVVIPKILTEGDHPFLHHSYAAMVERVIPVVSDQRIGINDVEIRILPTTHEHAIGIKFTLPQGVITYTGDTGYAPALIEKYSQSSIMILNLPQIQSDDGKELGIDDIKKILLTVKPKLAIIAKIGGEVLKQDPLFLARKIQLETGVPVICAKEGLIINPTNYFGEGQKTLRTFK